MQDDAALALLDQVEASRANSHPAAPPPPVHPPSEVVEAHTRAPVLALRDLSDRRAAHTLIHSFTRARFCVATAGSSVLGVRPRQWGEPRHGHGRGLVLLPLLRSQLFGCTELRFVWAGRRPCDDGAAPAAA